jgi:hypothetical protein
MRHNSRHTVVLLVASGGRLYQIRLNYERLCENNDMLLPLNRHLRMPRFYVLLRTSRLL